MYSDKYWNPTIIHTTAIITLLTHWGRVAHICLSKLTIIGSDNGLPPDRRRAIIWTNAGILLIGPLGTNLSEILIEIHAFSFKKMHLKTSSGKWPPFCLGLNVLRNHTLWYDSMIVDKSRSCLSSKQKVLILLSKNETNLLRLRQKWNFRCCMQMSPKRANLLSFAFARSHTSLERFWLAATRTYIVLAKFAWWRHQMETFSA